MLKKTTSSISKHLKFFIIFFDLGSLQTIRRVFDTDTLTLAEILGLRML